MNVTEQTKVEACAEAAHEANRIYCTATGDGSHVPWKDAPEWQRQSVIEGVKVALSGAMPEQQHEAWFKSKRDAGWVYGPAKNPDAVPATHPYLVPYAELPAEQRAKDLLYLASVRGMAAALGMRVTYPASPGYPQRTIDWSVTRASAT